MNEIFPLFIFHIVWAELDIQINGFEKTCTEILNKQIYNL